MTIYNRFNRPVKFLALLGAILYICIFSSCKDENTKDFKSNIVFPDSNISFSRYVEPLFWQTCVDPKCHGGSEPAYNLNLEVNSWNSLVYHVPSIVIPTDGANSPLVLSISGNPQRMPPFRGSPLTQNQINGVKKWIDEGAQPN